MIVAFTGLRSFHSVVFRAACSPVLAAEIDETLYVCRKTSTCVHAAVTTRTNCSRRVLENTGFAVYTLHTGGCLLQLRQSIAVHGHGVASD